MLTLINTNIYDNKSYKYKRVTISIVNKYPFNTKYYSQTLGCVNSIAKGDGDKFKLLTTNNYHGLYGLH